MVTGARGSQERLVASLVAMGAEVIECPMIEIAPPRDPRVLDDAVRSLADFRWLVLTSKNAAAAVAEALDRVALPRSARSACSVAAVGNTTADVAVAAGLRVVAVPARQESRELPALLGDVRGARILLPRSDIADPALPRALREAGADVREVEAYRTVTPDDAALGAGARNRGRRHRRNHRCERLRSARARLRDGQDRVRTLRARLERALIVCIGDSSANASRCAGLQVASVARTSDLDGLAQAVASTLSRAAQAS